MATHREELTKLILASPDIRETISQGLGIPNIPEAEWPRVVDIFIDFVGLYDGDKLVPDWRERIERGGA